MINVLVADGIVFTLITALVVSLLIEARTPRRSWANRLGLRCDHIFEPPDYTTCKYCHRTIPLPEDPK